MRKRPQELEYIVIGGFSLGQSEWDSSPRLVLMHGNGRGEKAVKTLKAFPRGTKYNIVKEAAEALSRETGIVLGRNFPDEQWNGAEIS